MTDQKIVDVVAKLRQHRNWRKTAFKVAGIDPDEYMGGHSIQDAIGCLVDEAGLYVYEDWLEDRPNYEEAIEDAMKEDLKSWSDG